METKFVRRALTVQELSDDTGVPLGTLRYWRHCGIGPKSYTIGRSVRYDSEDVESWIDAQKAATSRGGAA